MSANRWMDKVDIVAHTDKHTHTHIYIYTYLCLHMYKRLSLSHQKEWNNGICGNMDGPRDYHFKWCKSDKGKYIILLIGGI